MSIFVYCLFLVLLLPCTLHAIGKVAEPMRVGVLYSSTNTMAISKPAYIGRLGPDGQYEIIWKSAADIPGDPWIGPVSVDADKGH